MEHHSIKLFFPNIKELLFLGLNMQKHSKAIMIKFINPKYLYYFDSLCAGICRSDNNIQRGR